MLNTKVKPRPVIDPRSGLEVWSPYPLTRDEAIKEKCAKYLPMEPCPVHGHTADGRNPVVYTATGIRGCCAQLNAVQEYNSAVQRGEPTDPGQAHIQGLNYYWAPMEHRGCGHPGKRLLNGKCAECVSSVGTSTTPRQAAIMNGEDWYLPVAGDLCKQGHHALRRVGNGSCKQCEEGAKTAHQVVKPKPIHKDPACADMLIDRATARALGMKVYRTGEACGAGHTGFRYVTTCGCIQCLRG